MIDFAFEYHNGMLACFVEGKFWQKFKFWPLHDRFQTIYSKDMEPKVEQSKISLFIRDVCKGKSEEELKEAEQNFQDYLLVVKEICERLEREGITIPSFDD